MVEVTAIENTNFDEPLRVVAMHASQLMAETCATRVRAAAEVDGLLIQIAIGDWDNDEEDEDDE